MVVGGEYHEKLSLGGGPHHAKEDECDPRVPRVEVLSLVRDGRNRNPERVVRRMAQVIHQRDQEISAKGSRARMVLGAQSV
jgi:hypothetical protein